MTTEGNRRMIGDYLYCIIGAEKEQEFVSPAIGSRGDGARPHTNCSKSREKTIGEGVYSICYRDIAAVISHSPVMKYSISRENTMAHQKVMEELMRDFTVLPVRFGTVAAGKDELPAGERIRKRVLKARYDELKGLLTRMENKIELGLKAFWNDMKVVFEEILEENKDIKNLKEKIAQGDPLRTYGKRITLGEKVKNVMDRKKTRERNRILDTLKEAYVDMRCNKIFSDNMITNSSFLVEKSKAGQFDTMVDKLNDDYSGKVKFKYVGPVPPCNFVELVIALEGENHEGAA